MTNYLTSVGVQQVSITIAAGSLTGTATITAVGSGAFMLYQGINPSDTANLSDTNVYLTISGTTITATRGITGTSQTVTVKAVVIDGDPTNLIKSVQFFTAVLSAGSSLTNVTISSVTTANTAIAYLGQSPAASQTNYVNVKANVSLINATQARVTRDSSGTSGNVTVSLCVIEFQGSALASSTQQVASTSISGTVKNNTISSVNTANTMLFYGGQHGGVSANEAINFQYAQLTSSTNVAVTNNTAISSTTNNYNCTVVEFVSGVLAQAVQRGTIALSAAASNTATITSAATANSVANWLGNSSTATTLNPETSEYQITQTNATTLTMTAAASATGTGSYEAITFQPFSGGGATQGLFMQSLLNGLQVGGPFFANPIG